MPELSRFLGIVIGMFYREHGVPHFHAVYGEYEVSVEVETGTIHGDFPTRALNRSSSMPAYFARVSSTVDNFPGWYFW